MKYVSIDIETTGLNPETDQILEFGAIMDFELCNIDWTYEEFQVIRDICEKQCLTTSQVMKQALRTYQLVATGHSKLVEVNPIRKSIFQDPPM